MCWIMVLSFPLLEIKDLEVSINDNKILKSLNLKINKGEIQTKKKPKNTKKRTKTKKLAGHPAYSVLNGDILFKGSSILDLEPEERSHLKKKKTKQKPKEIPGVS